MANKPVKTNVDKMIDKSVGDAQDAERDDARTEEPKERLFRKFPEARVPVAKSAGALWKSRHDTGKSKLKNSSTYDAWEEAIKYYKNDQTGKRVRDDPDNPGRGSERLAVGGGAFAQTENIVFANVSALVPATYAKNPDVSIFSPRGDEDLPFSNCAQKLIRTLLQKRGSPGVNLKPKVRRSIVMTTLTNISYIEVGYVRREVAAETALAQVDQIADELEKATSPAEIERLEGELAAMSEKVDLLQPAGPYTVVRHPKDVIVDPDSTMPDHTDAKWIMIRDVMETSFLNAVYRTKDPETGEYKSIYKPDAVLKSAAKGANIAGHDSEIQNFSILSGDDTDHRSFGFDDARSFERAKRTFVWKVWDRITRRVYMYAENDWTWPVWVWDDPYGLEEFIPLYPLAYHTDPEDVYARGEVSYYLDQQDTVNEINSQVSRMRHRVSNMLVYNKKAIKDENDLASLTKPSNDRTLVGVTVPEGMKIGDMLSAPPVPAVEFASLFDKRSTLEAIDRVSGVSNVVKGVEYKTNTTNKAIDSYESSSAMRLDEKIDAIEEFVGRIGNAILVMCLQFMPKEEVVRLIGATNAEAWPPTMTAREAQQRFQLTVTGGSSLKPTSKVRKEQAKELGQIVGQFGQANPVAFIIVLRMLHRAYSDEMVIEKSDWDMLMQSAESAIQGEAGGGDPRAIIQKVSEAIQKMPDEIRAQLGQDIAKGVPLEQLLAKLEEVSAQRRPPAPQK